MRNAKRVLVVDDDRPVLAVLGGALRENGFDPVLCTRADDALAVVQKSPGFSLVLSDYLMPKMNGIELATCIRALDPTVPIVLMTAYPNRLQEIVDVGMVPLVKPFSIDVLCRVVGDLASQSTPPSPRHADPRASS